MNIPTWLQSRLPSRETLSRWGLPAVLATAALSNLLTFLALNWYAGMDNYSYDVAGLQLLTGARFDLYPLLYRTPLVPVLKNLLYLGFEGHPYLLCLLLHALGVLTVYLGYRLGAHFGRLAAVGLGGVLALNLNLPAMFHSVSTLTFYLPLLLWSAERFAAWTREPTPRRAVQMAVAAVLCALAEPDAFMLIPLYIGFGWIAHRQWRQAAAVSCLLYGLAYLTYAAAFGHWGLTEKTGWSLFNRVSRKADSQFALAGGPATTRLYEMMSRWTPGPVPAATLQEARMLDAAADTQNPAVKDIALVPLLERQMHTLNAAQKELGFEEADRLCLRAALESIGAAPIRYLFTSGVRLLCNLRLYRDERLRHDEFLLANAAFMRRMAGKAPESLRPEDRWLVVETIPLETAVPSPLAWERRMLKARLLSCLGFKAQPPIQPAAFVLSPNVSFGSGGYEKRAARSHCVMAERLEHAVDLDSYFFDQYWGPRLGRAYLYHGAAALRTKDYKRARQLLLDAVRLYPFNGYTCMLMGQTLRALGQRSEAVLWFRRAHFLEPNQVEPILELATFEISHQRARNAEDMLREILIQNPLNPEIYLHLGVLYRELDRPTMAQQMFENALLLSPQTPEVYFEYGRLYQQQGRFDLAQDMFRKALELRPEDTKASTQIAVCLREQGDLDTAIIQLQKAIKTEPDSIQPLLDLGDCYLRQERYGEARAAYEKAMKLDTANPAPLIRLGTFYCGQPGNEDKSLGFFLKAIRMAPEDRDPYVQMALAAMRTAGNGNFGPDSLQADETKILNSFLQEAAPKSGEVLPAASRSAGAAAANPQMLLQLGIFYQLQKKSEHALESLRQNAQMNPNRAQAWLCLGVCAMENERLTEADQALQKAAALEPNNESILLARGLLYRRQGALQMGASEQMFRRATTVAPEHATAYVELGINYQLEQQIQEASALYMQTSALAPEKEMPAIDPRLLSDAAMNDAAESDLLAAVAKGTDRPAACQKLAAWYFRHDQPENSLHWADEARKAAGADAARQFDAVRALVDQALVARRQQSTWPQAETLLRKAIADAPQLRQAFQETGALCFDTHRYGDAIQLFRSALTLAGSSARWHLQAGAWHMSKQRYAEALPYLQAAIALDPSSEQAHTQLGVCLRALGRNTQSLAMFKKATELDADSVQPYIDMGITYRDMGESDEAQKALSKAVALNPLNEQAYQELAEVYNRQGRAQAARDLLKSIPRIPAAGKTPPAPAAARKTADASIPGWNGTLEPVWLTLLCRRALNLWETVLVPGENACVALSWLLWALWILALVRYEDRRRALVLAALMAVVLNRVCVQALVDDNYGGRFFLHMLAFQVLGGFCGLGVWLRHRRDPGGLFRRPRRP